MKNENAADAMTLTELTAAETTIRKGLKNFVEVGEALSRIKTGKGYRHAGFRSFESYMKSRFNLSRVRGFQLIEAASIFQQVKELTGHELPNAAMAGAVKALTKQPEVLKTFVKALVNDNVGNAKIALNRSKTAMKVHKMAEQAENRKVLLADAPDADPNADSWIKVEACDFRAFLAGLETKSVDLLIVDPPWASPKFAEPLALEAKRVLKPDGILAVMSGNLCLPKWVGGLGKHMEYRWQIAYLTDESHLMKVDDRNVFSQWRPVLVFGGNGRRIKTDVIDLTIKGNRGTDDESALELERSSGDQKVHHWQQSNVGFQRLVSMLSKPGATVVDVFCGSGCSLVAGLKAEGGMRRVMGCDVEPDFAAVAKARALAAWQEQSKPENAELPMAA